MSPKTITCVCLNIWIILFVCLLYWQFVFVFNFILCVLISGLLVFVCLFVWVTEKNFTDVRATSTTLAAARSRYSPNGALLACSSCKKWARQKVWGQAVPWLRNISCSGHLCHRHDHQSCFCVCLCVFCYCVCILLYMFNIWVDVWLSLHYVIDAQACIKDAMYWMLN